MIQEAFFNISSASVTCKLTFSLVMKVQRVFYTS